MEDKNRIAALERALDEEVSQRIRAVHNLEHRLNLLELNREVALAQLVERRFKSRGDELIAKLSDCLSFDRPASRDQMVSEARDLMLAYDCPVGNELRDARSLRCGPLGLSIDEIRHMEASSGR
jgi:hypothetical protein